MIKVANKRVVVDVARRTFFANRKRNLLTIFAIILTTFLISMVFGVGLSYGEAVIQRNIQIDGVDFDIQLTEPREEQVETIRGLNEVESAGLYVKCATVTKGEGKSLAPWNLYWMDDICWEEQCLPAIAGWEGTFPIKENEVMLSTQTLKALGITSPQPGMEVSFNYYPLVEEGEKKDSEKTFVLSGYFRDYTGENKGYVSKAFYEKTGVKQSDFNSGRLCISLKNPLFTERDIQQIKEQVNVKGRQAFIGDYSRTADFIRMSVLVGGLLLMILVSGYLFIYNTFYISVSRDIRYYGQLKTLGMTSGQLRGVVYRQALWNSCIGIRLEILAGILVGARIIPKIIYMIGYMEIKMFQGPNFLIYGGAAIFSAVTVFSGSRKPAMMAGECTPVEALSYNGINQKKSVKKSQKGSISSMAYGNIFRDKKQAFVILSSFIVTLVATMCVLSFVRSNDAKGIINAGNSYDLRIKNGTTLDEKIPILTEDKIEALRKTKGVKSVSVVSSATLIVPYQKVYEEYYKNLFDSPRVSPGSYEENMKAYLENPESGFFTARLVGIDTEKFAFYNELLGNTLNQESFEKGETALVNELISGFLGEDVIGRKAEWWLADGMQKKQKKEVTIDGIVPPIYSASWFAGGYSPNLIISQDFMKQLMGEEYLVELLEVSYEEHYSREIEDRVKSVFAGETQIWYDSQLDSYEEMEVTENQIWVLGVSLIAILSFLSLLNYFNMMVASVQNRAKELAALESIGMTRMQIKKTLSLEGLVYAGISIAGAILLGTPLSILIFQNTMYHIIIYNFPILEMMILFIIIVILCLLIPGIIYETIQKGTIIEQLKRGDE